MNIIDSIVSLELYKKSTNKDYIELKCPHCGAIYSKQKRGIAQKMKRDELDYCSKDCKNVSIFNSQAIPKDELIKLFNLGYMVKSIAEALNENPAWARYWIKRLKLKRTMKRTGSAVDFQTVQVSGDYKYCQYCNTVKGLSDFYKCESGIISYRCKECDKAGRKAWHQNNKEYACEFAKQKQKTQRAQINLRKKERYHSDPDYKLRRIVSRSFLSAFKNQNISKTHSLAEVFDLAMPDLKAYLTGLFEPGMDWKNHGKRGWDIDHIIPMSAYDFKDLDEQKRCIHHLNLMPRWGTNKIAAANHSESIGNVEKYNYIIPELLTEFHLTNLMPKNGLIGFRLIDGTLIESKEQLESLIRAHLSSNTP